MKKNELDEREKRIVTKVGELSFYVMFGVCTMVIILELLWKGSLENVIGETIVLIAGGIACVAGCVKNGIWTTGKGKKITDRKVTAGYHLLLSVFLSGIFSAVYALIISKKASGEIGIARFVTLFFVGIAILCFVCLTVMERIVKKRKEKQEKKYLD